MIAEKIKFVDEQAILDAAEELFRTQGFDYTTVGDITHRLDISDAIFFHYFESLDEVLDVLWNGSRR